MANWEDIMSNHLTMGTVRWLTYAINARREEEERRPGAGPLTGREGRPEPPRVLHWEPPREENFRRHMIRGRSRPVLVPCPSYKFTTPLYPNVPPPGIANLAMQIPMPLPSHE